jgi:hypothetical protein
LMVTLPGPSAGCTDPVGGSPIKRPLPSTNIDWVRPTRSQLDCRSGDLRAHPYRAQHLDQRSIPSSRMMNCPR